MRQLVSVTVTLGIIYIIVKFVGRIVDKRYIEISKQPHYLSLLLVKK